MRKPKHPKGQEAMKAIRQINKKYGTPTTRWAVRKWDKGMTEKQSLLKRKRSLELELTRVKNSLR